MAKLTAAHLQALAREFKLALKEGAITTQQAKDFCDETYNITLEHIADDGNNAERVRPAQPAAVDERTSPTAGAEQQLSPSDESKRPRIVRKGGRRRR